MHSYDRGRPSVPGTPYLRLIRPPLNRPSQQSIPRDNARTRLGLQAASLRHPHAFRSKRRASVEKRRRKMSLRSRQTTSRNVGDSLGEAIIGLDETAISTVTIGDSRPQKKSTAKPRARRPSLILLCCFITCAAYILHSSPPNHQTKVSSESPRESNITSSTFAPMGSIIYGECLRSCVSASSSSLTRIQVRRAKEATPRGL